MIGLYSANSQAITSAPFSFGNALESDGVDDVVDINTPFTISQGTIAFWFKPLQTNYNRVISADGSTNLSYINPRIGFNQVLFRLNNSVNQLFFTDPIGMSIGTWYHVVCSFNSTTANCYINSVGSVENPYSLPVTSQSFQIYNLGRLWRTTVYSKHIIDEIAIWDVVLTSTQISNLYNSGNGDYATNYSPANLLAYWRMNGTSGDTIAIDEQGNYNGTLNNFNTSTCWVAH